MIDTFLYCDNEKCIYNHKRLKQCGQYNRVHINADGRCRNFKEATSSVDVAEHILRENGWEVGDFVVHDDGRIGEIIGICKCDQCAKRGFYELEVEWMISKDHYESDFITDYEWKNTHLHRYTFYKSHSNRNKKEED